MILLKNEICNPLADLFNLSFSSGKFPSVLKIAKVVPVYKKDSKLDYQNYRPISLLSNVEKVLEKLMYKRLYKFLYDNNILYDLRFDFRQNFSATHALINLTENLRQALDEGQIGCGIFLVLQKAFDTVEHEILLSKLDHYGVRGLTNNSFKSYLTARKWYVSINGYNSSLSSIAYGVPQGSVLGPLLFLLYINDLHRAIKFCKVHHFADDTNLLFLTNSIKKLNKLINTDLKNLSNWLNANKISLNVKKTETIIFKSRRKKYEGVIKLKLNRQRLHSSNNVKYLGIKIDENLNWKHHINEVSTKLIRTNAILFKIRNSKLLRSIYFAIFESHLNCSSLVWAHNPGSIKRLIILQKKTLRIINFKPRNCHTSPWN